MKMNRRVLAVLAAAIVAGPVSGCAVYVRPRPGVVYVQTRPPVARVEVIPAAPGGGFVWMSGYWASRNATFEWVPGRWERPIEGRREWVPHRWEHDRNGWYLVEGHWR
jgi:hypothetical protein